MADRSMLNTLAECQPAFVPYIMIVESDLALATMLQHTARQEMQVGTIFAETMQDALIITRTLCPTLFLIDYHLLGGNGLLLVDQLRENPLLASVPIIILTTNILNCQKKAEELGITSLSIPLELDDLLVIIKSHLPTSSY